MSRHGLQEDVPSDAAPSLEEIACNLCGSQRSTLRFRSERVTLADACSDFAATTDRFGAYGDVRQCLDCGLTYTSPRLDSTAVLRGYGEVEDAEYLVESDARSMNAYLALAQIRRHAPGGRLLEIGCSTGFFLNAARTSYEVAGIEPSSWARRYAREKLALPVVGSTLDDVQLADRQFDVVVMLDVIEHLTDPLAVMHEIARITRPGGIVYIVTPDIDSLSARVLGAKWWGLRPAHLYYFSRHTLTVLLRKAGFEVTFVRSYGRIFTWGYWFSRLANYPRAVRFAAECLVQACGGAEKFLYLDTRDSMQVIARRSAETLEPTPR